MNFIQNDPLIHSVYLTVYPEVSSFIILNFSSVTTITETRVHFHGAGLTSMLLFLIKLNIYMFIELAIYLSVALFL